MRRAVHWLGTRRSGEMADAADSKSAGATRGSSTLPFGTIDRGRKQDGWSAPIRSSMSTIRFLSMSDAAYNKVGAKARIPPVSRMMYASSAPDHGRIGLSGTAELYGSSPSSRAMSSDRSRWKPSLTSRMR